MSIQNKKSILAITGTRADFGKMKGLLRVIEEDPDIELHVVVTGMHMMKLYGYTLIEVQRENYTNLLPFLNQYREEPMESILGNTLVQLSRTIHEINPNMILIHGDRLEAMAGALAGALSNIRVCHIEGGEVSGTIDDLIRHSVSKLAHVHLVSNDDARNRLIKMGELPQSIYVIGSPDLDIMMNSSLPTIEEVIRNYEIPFLQFAIASFHSVTTEIEHFEQYSKMFFAALRASNKNFVVIHPNNDLGSNLILNEIKKLTQDPQFRVIPSMRFEYFLTLLKNAEFIVGNSSAGIREAPYYHVPTINVGTRQNRRFEHKIIQITGYDYEEILHAISNIKPFPKNQATRYFGEGNSIVHFKKLLQNPEFWNVPIQKAMTY